MKLPGNFGPEPGRFCSLLQFARGGEITAKSGDQTGFVKAVFCEFSAIAVLGVGTDRERSRIKSDASLNHSDMLFRLLVVVILVSILLTSVAAQNGAALSLGNPEAPNKVEVFYDLQCGACSTFHERLKKIVDQHPGKVFATIRHFPLQMHEQAFMASTVVEAAKRQGKGLEMTDLVLADQSRWSTSEKPFAVILEYVEKLGLDATRFKKDVLSDEVIKSVLFDLDRGKRLGIGSTPTTFLNGRQLSFLEATELEKFISEGK